MCFLKEKSQTIDYAEFIFNRATHELASYAMLYAMLNGHDGYCATISWFDHVLQQHIPYV